jgi:DNA-binding CsgD family transcriptional regulator
VNGDWLAGRGNEVALLRDLVAGVVAGVGGVVLVEGEQGIGKTELLRAGLAGAAAAGCRVAWGAADELGQRFPLRLMVECMGVGGLAELADGGDRDGGVLPLAGDPVVAAVERMLALVDRWCAQGPVVVVAEDLQWADEASVLVWHWLSRAAGQMPLLVAGSLRPAPGREDLAGVRRALVARGEGVVALGPLGAAEVAELVGRLVGGRPGRGLAGVIGQAGGNPLYARELADALVREGRVRVAGGVAELAGGVAAVGVPASLAGVIGGRLGSLGEGAVGVLRWAAVLGLEFSVADLGLVTGRDAGELAGVVAEAVAAGVVVEAGPRLAFRHGLIRQVLYEGMPASLRAALHVQAARVLAREGAAPERVAAQLVAAPEVAAGWVPEWLAGAAPVLSHRAPQVAAELLGGALARVAGDDPGREVLEAALVQVAFVLARYGEVERAGRQVLARTQDPDRAAQVAWLVAYTLVRTGRGAEAAALAGQALARPGVARAPAARLRGMHALTLFGLGRLDEAAGVAGKALASAEAAGDRFAAGFALHALAVANLPLSPTSALDHIERALAVIGDDPQTADLRLVLLSNKSATLEYMDRRAEALVAARQALALGERTGTPHQAMARLRLAELYIAWGQWDDALAELEQATGLPGPDHLYIAVHGYIALIAGHRDDGDTAEQHLAAVADVLIRDAVSWDYSALLLARALAAERAGRTAEAVAEFARCLEPGSPGNLLDRYMLLPTLVRLALAAGDAATAKAAARAAAAEAEREPRPVNTAAADHCRGLIEADPGPVLAAASYYQSAGRLLDRAQALEDAAVLLAGRGDTQAARAAFREAISGYEALGAEWDIRRASARLQPCGIRRGHRGARARPAAGWQSLTPTETKIAYLVAKGQSNSDIAAELWLSRNTVQTHISHILAKLSARSRVEIVRQALQHPPAREHAHTG